MSRIVKRTLAFLILFTVMFTAGVLPISAKENAGAVPLVTATSNETPPTTITGSAKITQVASTSTPGYYYYVVEVNCSPWFTGTLKMTCSGMGYMPPKAGYIGLCRLEYLSASTTVPGAYNYRFVMDNSAAGYASLLSEDVWIYTSGIAVSSVDSTDGIDLSWSEVVGASFYNVYETDGVNQWNVGSYTGTTARVDKYNNKNLLMGHTYSYVVEACNASQNVLESGTHDDMFNPFSDVADDDKLFDSIAWAYNNAIVKGTGKTTFEPEGPTTRMNFVMILYKMHGSPKVSGTNPFKDVSGSKSVKAVLWAYNKGLVKGTDKTHFSPDVNLSRINIIMILYKLAGSPKASTTTSFVDISGSKTIKAVNWAVNKGIITGVDDTHFYPDNDCSRALFVDVLYKYNKIYKILK